HPMIDPGLRNERFRREAADPETGVVLLDVVLGYGAHPDPGGELAPLIERTLADRPGELSVVVSLCGAAGDPQGLDGQAAALRAAGALVTPSSPRAARPAPAPRALPPRGPRPGARPPAPGPATQAPSGRAGPDDVPAGSRSRRSRRRAAAPDRPPGRTAKGEGDRERAAGAAAAGGQRRGRA